MTHGRIVAAVCRARPGELDGLSAGERADCVALGQSDVRAAARHAAHEAARALGGEEFEVVRREDGRPELWTLAARPSPGPAVSLSHTHQWGAALIWLPDAGEAALPARGIDAR